MLNFFLLELLFCPNYDFFAQKKPFKSQQVSSLKGLSYKQLYLSSLSLSLSLLIFFSLSPIKSPIWKPVFSSGSS